jgi:hypothetical protein
MRGLYVMEWMPYPDTAGLPIIRDGETDFGVSRGLPAIDVELERGFIERDETHPVWKLGVSGATFRSVNI